MINVAKCTMKNITTNEIAAHCSLPFRHHLPGNIGISATGIASGNISGISGIISNGCGVDIVSGGVFSTVWITSPVVIASAEAIISGLGVSISGIGSVAAGRVVSLTVVTGNTGLGTFFFRGASQ